MPACCATSRAGPSAASIAIANISAVRRPSRRCQVVNVIDLVRREKPGHRAHMREPVALPRVRERIANTSCAWSALCFRRGRLRGGLERPQRNAIGDGNVARSRHVRSDARGRCGGDAHRATGHRLTTALWRLRGWRLMSIASVARVHRHRAHVHAVHGMRRRGRVVRRARELPHQREVEHGESGEVREQAANHDTKSTS